MKISRRGFITQALASGLVLASPKIIVDLAANTWRQREEVLFGYNVPLSRGYYSSSSDLYDFASSVFESVRVLSPPGGFQLGTCILLPYNQLATLTSGGWKTSSGVVTYTPRPISFGEASPVYPTNT